VCGGIIIDAGNPGMLGMHLFHINLMSHALYDSANKVIISSEKIGGQATLL